MSRLLSNAPYYKKFLAGEKGHSHAAQEFGVIAVVVSLLGWALSPIASALFVFVLIGSNKIKLPMVGDKYWIQREVRQALERKRNHNYPDLIIVPKYPNAFWTLDAIADVTFPRKLRPLFGALVLVYSWFIYLKVGI